MGGGVVVFVLRVMEVVSVDQVVVGLWSDGKCRVGRGGMVGLARWGGLGRRDGVVVRGWGRWRAKAGMEERGACQGAGRVER